VQADQPGDGDGDEDLFVANGLVTSQRNCLYRNEGPATGYSFVRVAEGDIVDDGGGSRAASWGDCDNDGDLDLFVVNQQAVVRDLFYLNNGDGTFTKVTDGPMVYDSGLGDPATWIDFDNDGYLDVFVGNSGANFLYRNNGNQTFTKLGSGAIVTDSEYNPLAQASVTFAKGK